VLEYKVDRPFIGRNAQHALAADIDVAVRGFRQAGDHAQQGRLAAAGGAENGKELAIRNFK